MTRNLRHEVSPASLQCDDCHSLATAGEPYCGACGGRLRRRKTSKVAYNAIAAFIAFGAVLLYWIERA